MLLGGRPFATSGFVGTHESEHDEKVEGVEAWELKNPAFGESTEKVCILPILQHVSLK